MKITKRLLFVFVLALFMASSAFAGPLDNLKTTWERAIENMTDADRNNPSFGGGDMLQITTRMQRAEGNATSNAQLQTTLPAGFPAEGEILPFVKIVANNSGGRVRYETMGYSVRGVPIPLLVVGVPKAPKGPEEVGERFVLRWQCSIHGNENEGTEGSLIFLREVAQGKWDELLKDIVVLVTPAVNPDGKNLQQRANAQGYDLNRVWSAVNAPEVQAALRLYRKWDPFVVLDHHRAGLNHRHVVTYANGKWGNNDPDIDFGNARYAESVFGDGPGKFVDPVTNFYKIHVKKTIDDYSPGNAAGNKPIALSTAFLPGTNTPSPEMNSVISLVAMPYMEEQPTALVSRDVGGVETLVREIVTMPNAISDSTRSSSTLPVSKNRYAILMEIYGSPHTFLKVNAMYAAGISAIEQAVKQKDEINALIKGKDAAYSGLNNSSPSSLTTVFQGAIDYRPNGANGGNASAPFRKILNTGHDIGWGPGIFKLEGYGYNPGTSTMNRSIIYTHYPELLLNNVPQYPIKMGAFYVMDPRATTAVHVLQMQGVEVYKLKQDVPLPDSTTYKFYGPGGNEKWGVTKNTSVYEGIYTTKVPRKRAEIIANDPGGDYSAHAVTLTGTQIPAEAYAPTDGGGDWLPAPTGHVAKAGYFVIPTAQRFARYAAFQLEPRSNCGLLFWAHWDDAVGGDGRNVPDNFNLDLVKTFDYTAIPASALELLTFAEDANDKPDDTFAAPKIDFPATGLVNEGASVQDAYQCPVSGALKVTIKDACLHDGMWLTFFFFDDFNKDPIAVLMQVFEGDAPGEYKAEFPLDELLAEGLKYGVKYAIQYSNEAGDIYGYGTFTKGEFSLAELKGGGSGGSCPIWGDDDECKGCNAGFAILAFLTLVPFFAMKKR